MGLITPSYKNVIITETRSRSISFENGRNTMTVSRSRCTMTLGSQTRKEAPEPTGSLVHPKNTLKIGNWNVRTLYRTGNLAQAAREMNRRGISIMGISETLWTGQGKLQIAEGETIIYSGREDDIHRAGVGILMSQDATGALIEWTPVSERIIQARFHSRHIKLTVIHVYAPTEDADEETKDEFYARLQEVLDKRNKHDMLVITRDMNAKVGEENANYERVMGKHGLGVRNGNGENLCDMCDMNELVITGTLFPHKIIHKATWISPDGRTRNQIDHVLINKRFRNSVEDTRVYRSADLGSDHYLVCTTIRLKLKRPPRQKKTGRVKYDTSKLGNEDTLKEFKVTLIGTRSYNKKAEI